MLRTGWTYAELLEQPDDLITEMVACLNAEAGQEAVREWPG